MALCMNMNIHVVGVHCMNFSSQIVGVVRETELSQGG